MKTFTILGFITVSFLIFAWVYYSTKESYRAVGFNDGIIEANIKFIEKLRAHGGKVIQCDFVDKGAVITKIATAKAESIYLVRRPSGIEFCEYR